MNRYVALMLTITVVIAFMMVFAGPVAHFVQRHPTVRMLALSFLLLIGLTLIVAKGSMCIFQKATSILRWDFLYSWRWSISGCAKNRSRFRCTSDTPPIAPHMVQRKHELQSKRFAEYRVLLNVVSISPALHHSSTRTFTSAC